MWGGCWREDTPFSSLWSHSNPKEGLGGPSSHVKPKSGLGNLQGRHERQQRAIRDRARQPLLHEGDQRGISGPPDSVHLCARAAVTEHHRRGGLEQQKLLPHSSGGPKSEIKVSAELVPSWGFRGRLLPRLSLLSRGRRPALVFLGSESTGSIPGAPCVSLTLLPVSSYEDTSQGFRAHPDSV